ncbi:hypothetical protein NKJ26_17010 [Mesorhizobium sp. M0152]|uniref:hypothetical protein n=1 Tax=Mesorhizobium sp. M0152 TaxID=2956898 RepID=UPI00333BBB66
MSTSRRALLSMIGATVAYAAVSGIASAKGGGGGGRGGKGSKDGAMDIGSGLVPASGTSPKQVKTFKSFQGKACNRDYKSVCPTTPIGKCDLQSKMAQLSPACRTFVEQHR